MQLQTLLILTTTTALLVSGSPLPISKDRTAEVYARSPEPTGSLLEPKDAGVTKAAASNGHPTEDNGFHARSLEVGVATTAGSDGYTEEDNELYAVAGANGYTAEDGEFYVR